MIVSVNNGETRRVSLGESIGAIIRPGRSHIQCGDSLLIDTDNRFFAVADSPERCPSASSDFLDQLAVLLDSFQPKLTATDQSLDADNLMRKRLTDGVNSIIENVNYNDNTTFTGLMILQKRKEAILLHSGDSLMHHIGLHEQSAEKITETNHWFVGRSKKIFQTRPFKYNLDSRFLLSSDGFLDLCKNCRLLAGEDLPREIVDAFSQQSMAELPGFLLKKFDKSPETSDDIGIIALNPNWNCCETGVTTPSEKAANRSTKRRIDSRGQLFSERLLKNQSQASIKQRSRYYRHLCGC